MPDLPSLLDLARAAACEAGVLLRDGQRRVRASVTTKSTATDMVTEMDTAAERLIVERILAARPDDGILGEESPEAGGTSGVRWVIDPLDGTTNYLYGIPQYAVAIGVEIEGDVAVGVVHAPAAGETFTAVKDGGAFLNDARLTVEGPPTLATALVGTGFAYLPDRRAHHGAVVAAVLPQVRDVRRFGSAALDLCWVAAGRIDCYFERYMGVWDYTAGGLVAAEAGAWVGGFDGGPPSTMSTMAAPPHLAAAFRDLVAAAENAAGPLP